jgi:hypothetical protein
MRSLIFLTLSLCYCLQISVRDFCQRISVSTWERMLDVRIWTLTYGNGVSDVEVVWDQWSLRGRCGWRLSGWRWRPYGDSYTLHGRVSGLGFLHTVSRSLMRRIACRWPCKVSVFVRFWPKLTRLYILAKRSNIRFNENPSPWLWRQQGPLKRW